MPELVTTVRRRLLVVFIRMRVTVLRLLLMGRVW